MIVAVKNFTTLGRTYHTGDVCDTSGWRNLQQMIRARWVRQVDADEDDARKSKRTK